MKIKNFQLISAFGGRFTTTAILFPRVEYVRQDNCDMTIN